jgi:HlyD family secretion protein/S-layer protein transport system membrane fusion protein
MFGKPREGAPDNVRRIAFVGFGIIIFAFGIVGGWAATAPLGSAAIGSGVVVAETNKKTVQHFEGGIVASIHVREGDRVKAGDVLFKLDPTQPQANYDIHRNQLTNFVAQEARLIAERENLPAVVFPEEWRNQRDDPTVERAVTDQNRQFQERRASLEGQIDLQRSRIIQMRTEISGLKREQAGREQQVGFLVDEIAGLRQLFEKGLAPKTRLLALEREKAALEGQIGRSLADQAKAENGIAEAELQIRQLRQNYFEQVVKELVDVRAKIADLRERITVARDVLRRLDVISPVTGTVQGLQVFTVGAVIRPGQPLVDVVPEDDNLIIQAQFSPMDSESLQPGREGEVRFVSFVNRTLPIIPGTIRSVSRDRLVDEATKQSYYLAVVVVNQKDLPEELKGRLTSGLPAEVMISTTERTVVEYLVQPLMATLRKTMRER